MEFTTRLAKILARRIGGAVYVGCSVEVGGVGAGAGIGQQVEEEVDVLKACVDGVISVFDKGGL